MASVSLAKETPSQALVRLQHEIAHLNEQCQTSHGMAMFYRAKYRACEVERARLAKQLTPKAAKDANTRHEENQADIDARFGLFAEDQADDAEVPL
jgi:hypothetical protein